MRTSNALPALDVSHIASGGYNDIWLIQVHRLAKIEILERLGFEIEKAKTASIPSQFVLRVPQPEALHPIQLRNEVAFLTLMASKYPEIPVPHVYAWNDDPENPYIAMEYIEGKPLCETWRSFSEDDKESVAKQLATINIKMLEIHSYGIGGLDPITNELAPPVEGCKLFKGRNKFHSREFYDIGPYKTTREYVLAYYDKEIVYHSQAPDSDIESELFEETSLPEFLEFLRTSRERIEADVFKFQEDEPFVLIHGDLAPRNIMVKGCQIVAILDWEFAGFFPLSLSPEPGIFEMDEDDEWDEFSKWKNRCRDLSEEIAQHRGWSSQDIELMLSYGNPEMHEARSEMVPSTAWGSNSNESDAYDDQDEDSGEEEHSSSDERDASEEGSTRAYGTGNESSRSGAPRHDAYSNNMVAKDTGRITHGTSVDELADKPAEEFPASTSTVHGVWRPCSPETQTYGYPFFGVLATAVTLLVTMKLLLSV
jgi:aminoglycoside phosphotransferase (APT) family kinase protein